MSTETKTSALAERRLFDVKGARDYLVSIGATAATVSFIRTLIGSGQVPSTKIGKAFYISRADLDTWLERHRHRNRG